MPDSSMFDINSFAQRFRDTGLILKHRNWEPDMLAVVDRGIERFNQVLGNPNAIRYATGKVSLAIDLKSGGLAYPWWIFPWWKRIVFGVGTLRQEPRWRGEVAVVHELAHQWDAQNANWRQKLFGGGGRIVRELVAFVGDEPGPTCYGGLRAKDCTFGRVPVEEWAESVASYVYPEYIDWLHEHEPTEKEAGLRPKHREFVAMQIEELRRKFETAE